MLMSDDSFPTSTAHGPLRPSGQKNISRRVGGPSVSAGPPPTHRPPHVRIPPVPCPPVHGPGRRNGRRAARQHPRPVTPDAPPHHPRPGCWWHPPRLPRAWPATGDFCTRPARRAPVPFTFNLPRPFPPIPFPARPAPHFHCPPGPPDCSSTVLRSPAGARGGGRNDPGAC